MALTRRAVLAADASLPFAALAEPGQSLRVAIPVGPNHSEPLPVHSRAALRTTTHLFDSLLYADVREDGAIRPALAEGWRREGARAPRLWLRPPDKVRNSSFGPRRA